MLQSVSRFLIVLCFVLTGCDSVESQDVTPASEAASPASVFTDMDESKFAAWLEGSRWSADAGNVKELRFEDGFILFFDDDDEELFGYPYHVESPGHLYYKYMDFAEDREMVVFAGNGRQLTLTESQGRVIVATFKSRN